MGQEGKKASVRRLLYTSLWSENVTHPKIKGQQTADRQIGPVVILDATGPF